MDKIKSVVVSVALPSLLIISSYLIRILNDVIQKGYSSTEMDCNRDGAVAFSEYMAAADVGKRQSDAGDKNCTESFQLKDGLTVKTICDH